MRQEYNHSYIPVNNHGCLTTYNHGCTLLNMNFNERLKKAREYAGLTQKELVDRLGTKPDGRPLMSQANLAKLEKNPNAQGSIYTVFIAKVCGVNAEWLSNEIGEMIDGIYVNDPDIKSAVLLMQEMAPYERQLAIKEIKQMKELVTKLQQNNKDS